jgi:hypothetical protein
VGLVAHMGQMRNASGSSVGKPEGKRQFRRPQRRWRFILKQAVDLIRLSNDTDLWRAVLNLRLSLKAGNSFTS